MIFFVLTLRVRWGDNVIKRLSLMLVSIVLLQLTAGLANLLLLAPVWMQLIHLILADSLWIGLVLLSASVLGSEITENLGGAQPKQITSSPNIMFKV
jgi:heme A synthase